MILVAVASYELRGLLTSVTHACTLIAGSSAPLWLVAGLTLTMGVMLLQVGRGLNRVATIPRWTVRLIGLWLMLCSVLLVLFSVAGGLMAGHGLPSHVVTSDGPWADATAALALALILSVSIEGGGWLAHHPPTVAIDSASAAADDPAQVHQVASEHPPASPPLLAGWSDRGPPSRLSPQTI